MPDPQDEFEDFARARTPAMLRSARLLCRDDQLAEDLVQDTLAKVYVRWHAPLRGRIDNPVAYAHTALTRTFLSSRRRRSNSERPSAELPERVTTDLVDETETRLMVRTALGDLTPADRAVLVLRYLEDHSVEETARLMGVSPGAVRSRTMRALTRMRPLLDRAHVDADEKGKPHE